MRGGLRTDEGDRDRAARAGPDRGGAFLVGNLDGLPENGALEELFTRFPERPTPEAYEPAPPAQPRTLVRERDSNQSHLRMSYRPAIEIENPKERAALVIYSTLLGGSMGSRLFDEIREQRGLAYSVHAIARAPAAYARARSTSSVVGPCSRSSVTISFIRA